MFQWAWERIGFCWMRAMSKNSVPVWTTALYTECKEWWTSLQGPGHSWSPRPPALFRISAQSLGPPLHTVCGWGQRWQTSVESCFGQRGRTNFKEVPEQSLEVLRKFGPASIAWIHRDEDANRRTEIHIFSQEVKPLFLIPDGILDAFDLHICQRQDSSWKLWVFGGKENKQCYQS